ncbi:MAG: 3-deoxy-D-manno-octulosonic acid transferase [Bacteroidales bacterium]|nr:3-deoxy-D-manno-octulosonic acid transferase [Bacteroidales bacterium]
MKYLYNIGILIYTFAARILSPFSGKARLWTSGRKDWEKRLGKNVNPLNTNLWIHCASLGEFEQGRPLMETIKRSRPDIKIILTFFSPSGYEIRKNYNVADYVCYLPADSPGNAAKFISLVNPAAVIFVKYEFWNNYISLLDKLNIPLYLVSGIFRPGQHFFRWYGKFFRRMLLRFTHIFVQDSRSAELLRNAGIEKVTVAGDTRFDRVVEIAASAKEIPGIEKFRGTERLVMVGSSWWQDEEIIARYIREHAGNLKWVFAPHEIDIPNIGRLEKLLGQDVVRFSDFNGSGNGARIMIIDNIGMLSSAYRYAHIAVIGGGFGKGIHNILEAACWGIPVVFGPNHKKFREAVEMIAAGGAGTYSNYDDFRRIIDGWLADENSYRLSAGNALEYVRKNTGATSVIMSKLNMKDMNKSFS